MSEILPAGADPVRLERLVAIDRRSGFETDAMLRLAALCPEVGTLAERWNFPSSMAAADACVTRTLK